MNTVADRHRHSAYHNKHLWQAFCIHEHQWPWTTLNPKNIDFTWFFGNFWLQKGEFDEMDGDRLRLPANRNCCWLSRVSWALLKLLVFAWLCLGTLTTGITRVDLICQTLQLLQNVTTDNEVIKQLIYATWFNCSQKYTELWWWSVFIEILFNTMPVCFSLYSSARR